MLFVCVLVGGVALENMCGYGIMCGETATGDLRVPRHVCPFFLCFFFFFVCSSVEQEIAHHASSVFSLVAMH
jgi:hypothetical protein